METRMIAAEHGLSYWAQIMSERANSGLSIREFCEQAEISENAYYYWQRKLREKACDVLARQENKDDLTPKGFVQLVTKATNTTNITTPPLTIDVNGCKITATHETDLTLLSKVCRVLGGLSAL